MKMLLVSACIFYKRCINKALVVWDTIFLCISTENCLKQVIIVAAQIPWVGIGFTQKGADGYYVTV